MRYQGVEIKPSSHNDCGNWYVWLNGIKLVGSLSWCKDAVRRYHKEVGYNGSR